MNVDEFIKLALKSDIRFPRHENGWYSSEFKGIAALTKHIDYDCQFVDGNCKSRDSKMCCCTGCRHTLGHNRSIIHSYADIKRMAKCYNTKTGFWRKDKGCILPRELMSATCLGHHCKEKLTGWENLILQIIGSSCNRWSCDNLHPDHLMNLKKQEKAGVIIVTINVS